MPNTVQFHLVLRTTPERLYRAFIDPDAMVKWLPPNGFTGKVHHMDPRVGGTYKMSFTNSLPAAFALRATADKASLASWTLSLFREGLRDFQGERRRVRV